MSVKITGRVTSDGSRIERTVRELRSLEVRIGFQHGKETEKDGTDICDIALWNEFGTSTIPSRPFLRDSFDNNEAEIVSRMKSMKGMVLSGQPAGQILKILGIFMKDKVQETITDGNFVPNAPSTIRKKKSSHPLIGTGRMRQSVNYVIQPKGSGGE